MILNILLLLITYILKFIVFILPTWSLWPSDLLTGITYFCSTLAKLNFIFPIDTLFACINFLIGFEVLYLGAKLIMKGFNYFRGTGSGIDI